jgi:hypothetical protein
VDTVAPTVAITTESGATFLPGDSFEISGTAGDNRTLNKVDVTFYDIRGTKVAVVRATLTAAADGTFTWTAKSTLLPGLYTITATATDGVGLRANSSSVDVVHLAVALPA